MKTIHQPNGKDNENENKMKLDWMYVCLCVCVCPVQYEDERVRERKKEKKGDNGIEQKNTFKLDKTGNEQKEKKKNTSISLYKMAVQDWTAIVHGPSIDD